MFDQLEIKERQTWLQHPCNIWSFNTDFMIIKEFAGNLALVNGLAELGDKLINDIINMSKDERHRHFNTQVIEWLREEYPVFTKRCAEQVVNNYVFK